MHSASTVHTQPIDDGRTLIHCSNLLWGLLWMWLSGMGLAEYAVGTVWGLWYVTAMICSVLMVSGGISGLVNGESILPRIALTMFALSLVSDWVYALPNISNMSLLATWTMILWVVNCDFGRQSVSE